MKELEDRGRLGGQAGSSSLPLVRGTEGKGGARRGGRRWTGASLLLNSVCVCVCVCLWLAATLLSSSIACNGGGWYLL